MKRKLIKAALWLAGVHTSCATFWNDVAESLHTGKPIWLIRQERKEEERQ